MKNGNTYTKINYSLELLRLLLSFWVILYHCHRTVYKFKGKFHVPTFMIMSFYFYYNTLKAKNIPKMKQRIERIVIPYIIWPIFIFIFDHTLFKIYRFSLFTTLISLRDIIFQLIFGSNYHPIFYYQFILIILTLLFNIISFLFNKYLIFILQILLIVAYIFQYKYLNLIIKQKYPKYFVSIGIIFELLLFSVVGITIRYFDINTKLHKFKGLTIFFIGAIIYFILEFDIFVSIEGILYPGIMLSIGGTCIFILFSLFSFQNRGIISFLKIITKFTGGIYYIHMICFNFLRLKFKFIKKMTLHGSVVIYIVSYIICFFGNKLSFNNKMKLLFN
jgi:fucose 4-O-acetylase-like acetyltransferase